MVLKTIISKVIILNCCALVDILIRFNSFALKQFSIFEFITLRPYFNGKGLAKRIIGRVDRIDFPELDLFNIAVKVDTGAYTSAIHCSKIVEDDGKLHCTFYSKGHPLFSGKEIVFNEFSRTDVKSSNGHKENRYKIKSQVVVFGKCYKINLTLSTRDDMKFPVLLGRQFLKQKFLVDVDLEYVSFNLKCNEHSNTI